MKNLKFDNIFVIYYNIKDKLNLDIRFSCLSIYH
jgi:hypothetical protein